MGALLYVRHAAAAGVWGAHWRHCRASPAACRLLVVLLLLRLRRRWLLLQLR